MGAALFGGAFAYRWYQMRASERDRTTYAITFPRDIKYENVLELTRGFHGIRKPKFLRPEFLITFDIYRDGHGLKWFLTVPEKAAAELSELIRTHINGTHLVIAEDDPVASTAWLAARQLRTGKAYLPFDIDNPAGICAGLLSKFSPVADGQALVMQWSIVPSRDAGRHQPSGVFASAISPELYKKKMAEHQVIGLVRIAASGRRADALVQRLYSGLARAHGNGQAFRDYIGTSPKPNKNDHVGRRVSRRSGALVYDAQLNSAELAALIGIPFGTPEVQGIPQARTKQLQADQRLPAPGPDKVTLGHSTYSGDQRAIAVPIKDQLRHTYIIGQTGVGKSYEMGSMLVQQVEQGYGAGVVDPTGDFTRTFVPMLPPERAKDVIIFDPTDTDFPVGFNVFAGDDEPDVLADNIMAIFHGIYRDNGIFANNYLRASVQTLASVAGMTLCEIPALLTDDTFRQRILSQVTDSQLLHFWNRFNGMARGERANAIAPAMHRVQPLLLRKSVRMTLGQSKGALDMNEIIRSGKILFCNLPKGLLGEETAKLFGSLIFAKGWTAAMSRPEDARKPWFLHVDEAHNFMNMPMSLETVLSEARKFGYGLDIAHQYESQLTPQLRSAVGIVGTKIIFQVSPDDSRSVANMMAPYVDQHDPKNLGKYEMIIRTTVDNETMPPATIKALEPKPHRMRYETVRALSERQYGTLASKVEREIIARQMGVADPTDEDNGPQGREEL